MSLLSLLINLMYPSWTKVLICLKKKKNLTDPKLLNTSVSQNNSCSTSSDIPAAPAVWATVWVTVSAENCCCLLSCSCRDRFPRMLRSRVMRVAVRSEERVYWDASQGSSGSGISASPLSRPYNRAYNCSFTCADTWRRYLILYVYRYIYEWKKQDKCIMCCI